MSTKPPLTLLQAINQSPSDLTPAPLTGSSTQVSFEFQNIAPPSQLYVNVDDNLFLIAATSQTAETVTVNVRLQLPNGRLEDMQFTLNPPNTRVPVVQSFRLAEGFILSASAVASVSQTRGQTFLRVAIARSASGANSPAQMLFADYVTTRANSAFPYGRVLSPSEGPGYVYLNTYAAPLAGQDIVITVPNNTRWKVRSWRSVLTCSATVANRQVAGVVGQSGNWMWQASALSAVVASSVTNISFANLSPYTPSIAADLIIPFPQEVVLNGNTNANGFGTLTVGLQAGDQFSTSFLLLEEWLENV
jgi:hypothetical protein